MNKASYCIDCFYDAHRWWQNTPLHFLIHIIKNVWSKLKLTKAHPQWLIDEATIEKMGELMATNNSKFLGMYNELSTFLAQINVY